MKKLLLILILILFVSCSQSDDLKKSEIKYFNSNDLDEKIYSEVESQRIAIEYISQIDEFVKYNGKNLYLESLEKIDGKADSYSFIYRFDKNRFLNDNSAKGFQVSFIVEGGEVLDYNIYELDNELDDVLSYSVDESEALASIYLGNANYDSIKLIESSILKCESCYLHKYEVLEFGVKYDLFIEMNKGKIVDIDVYEKDDIINDSDVLVGYSNYDNNGCNVNNFEIYCESLGKCIDSKFDECIIENIINYTECVNAGGYVEENTCSRNERKIANVEGFEQDMICCSSIN